MKFKLGIVVAVISLLLSLVPFSHGGGVTIITHGLNGNADGWVTGMANQIPNYTTFPGSSYTFYKLYFYYSGGSYYMTWVRLGGSQPTSTDSGEIIVALDWSQLADGDSYNTYQIASAVSSALQSTNFISELNGHALCELPLHLIGHSRGGSLISEVSQRLGTNGVWVDHFTTLDPHPLNNDGFSDFIYSAVDAPVRTYENVLFHDNYWQNLNFFVYGEPVSGAYVRELYNLSGGYSSSHSDVHLWYHGTVDERNPASDTEAQITSAEFGSWYVSYENYGFDAGFKYGLIGGGDRTSLDQPVGAGFPSIRDGYNQTWDLGAGQVANRTSLPSHNAYWPNIIKFDITGSHTVAVSNTVSMKYFYQFGQSTSTNATVQVYLDGNANPLDGNSGLVFQFTETGTGANIIRSRIITFNPTNTPGQYYLYAKVTSGTRTRYLPAPGKLTITPPPDTTRPTITITNPAANAQFTNTAIVAVQGTAVDNGQVAAVNYQLNGGGWNLAAGTSNWETPVTLVQGTNVFEVFSVDSAGNNSLTNSRNIILVLTAPIVVQTNGTGTVSPNYNGQMLEIGKSYSMTATAGAGFMFANWSGSVPTNGPTVKFIMASDLVLTANFVDIQKPTVSIANPPSAKTYTNSQTVTLSATAADNIGVANVEFYDGGILKGSDTTPTYTFDWSFTDADNGAHVWTARAYDAAGNVSTSGVVTLTISVDITPPTVVISSPTNGANVTTSPTTVSGTASDSGSPTSGLNLVEVRVNGGSWSNATGTASWTRSITLSPCANTIEARSLDKAGNYSAIASNLVTYIPPNTPPNTPSNVSPANGAANVSVMPTLQGSAFSDADCVGDTHVTSQWQVLNSPGVVVVADSGTNTVNTVSWLVPTNKLYYGSNYQWHVRYRDSRNGWSSYSPQTFFTNGGPVLIGTKQGTNMVFKWPTNALGFSLQWVTNLPPVNWSNATPAPVIVIGQYTVTNSMTNNVRFYRLKK